jgi:hypothetical protein
MYMEFSARIFIRKGRFYWKLNSRLGQWGTGSITRAQGDPNYWYISLWRPANQAIFVVQYIQMALFMTHQEFEVILLPSLRMWCKYKVRHEQWSAVVHDIETINTILYSYKSMFEQERMLVMIVCLKMGFCYVEIRLPLGSGYVWLAPVVPVADLAPKVS